MTKPFTGVANQILVDEGKIKLGDPVAKYLPGFDNDRSRAITIE
jgi:CubicO group peptidase (beta-lactamase class C family)